MIRAVAASVAAIDGAVEEVRHRHDTFASHVLHEFPRLLFGEVAGAA